MIGSVVCPSSRESRRDIASPLLLLRLADSLRPFFPLWRDNGEGRHRQKACFRRLTGVTSDVRMSGYIS
jgi:hypothetical protein